jgi:DNA-binding CsgD family transcriptional regulator
VAGAIDDGRTAFSRREWRVAFDRLTSADAGKGLEPEDLELLATAAVLAGRRVDGEAAWERAHRAWKERGDVARATRCAFWLAFRLINSGDIPRGAGWLERAQRELDERELDCVEQGYLQYCGGLRRVFEGDAEGALSCFVKASEIGARHGSVELTTLARVGEGRCVIYLGEIAAGIALLDEAIVSFSAEEVSPIAVGDVFCTVIDGCYELLDIQRSATWTTMLDEWCESQPELVLYRGECLLHRAEVLQLRGHWAAALREAGRISDRLAEPAGPAIHGAALYLTGNVQRLLGALAEAEDAYREASRVGHDPQPGLALLRLAQGEVDPAFAAVCRALDGAQDPMSRARTLPAYVEISLAARAVDAASEGAEELRLIAERIGTPYLRAAAAQGGGAVRLALDDPRGALALLRQAADGWRALEAPYEHGVARSLLADAYAAVGDMDSAALERDGARATFGQLGAAHDLARPAKSGGERRVAGGLTRRELEILQQVAQGKTNSAIAAQLVISERTVETHVRNIFSKLGVSTRTAATAYAYEHGLAPRLSGTT